MYIKYTFVHFAILLIRQILGIVPLLVTSPFAVKALSFRLGSRLGFLAGSGNFLAILLIRQSLGLVLFPLMSPLAVEALSLRLRIRFGLLHLSSNLLAVLLEVPFLPFTLFLETGGLVDHQHLMLLLDFYLHSFQHCEELENSLVHPLHTIVHHKVLLTW